MIYFSCSCSSNSPIIKPKDPKDSKDSRHKVLIQDKEKEINNTVSQVGNLIIKQMKIKIIY